MLIPWMRSMFGLLGVLFLANFVSAQDTTNPSGCGTLSSSCGPSSTITSMSVTSSTPSTTSAAVASGTVVVDQAGGGQFTAINAAISYAQTFAQPTVVVRAGTYNEAVTVLGSAPLTIIGDSPANTDSSKNTVTIYSSVGGTVPMSIGTNSVTGITWRNINFVNTGTGNAATVSLRGTKNAFYNCRFVSSGATAIVATLGITIIANSYIEGTDKLFYGYLGMYVFNSTIAATSSSATIVYSHGYGQVSQTAFDSCSIIQKPGTTNSYVYLAGPNGDGSQAVFKYTSMASCIAPGGTRALGTNGFYGEYQTTGPGSYLFDSQPVDTLMTTSMLSSWTIDYLFANSFSGYTTPTASWVDSSVYQAILAANIVAPSSSLSSSSASVTSSSTFSTSSSTISPSSSVSAVPASATYVVSTSPNTTEYGTVEAAISALPNDGAEKFILIMPGTYTEQININRTGKVTIRGTTNFVNDFSQNQVIIQFSYGVSTSAGQDELTPVINSKKNDGSGLALYNINFVNTFPQTKNFAALAADFYGPNMAAYGCSFIGYQDVLLANQGTQLFSNCYIEGSVDFVWGFSRAYFHQCYIATNTPGASISAQSRASATTPGGYVFDSCLITYTSTYGQSFGLSYLGRPYSNFSVAVYKNSYLDKNISPAGWSVWQTSNPQTNNVMFGEYNNVGPSSWSASRATFATNLTDSQVAAYDLGTFLGSTSWIDTQAYSFTPSFSFSGSGTNGTLTPTGPPAGPTTNSTTSHPTSGTVPPAGAVLVSVGGTIANSFASLTSALASLPADTTSQVIFMYPGSYTEQVSINRPGPIVIIGYQAGNVGQSYSGNQVTVTYSRGLSVVAPIPAGHTDAETAVIATASNTISFYNVNFINTDNLDGATSSFVTLAASVYGDHIGFYGCSFIGWQDTLLTGNPTGYAYYESSYIEGAIDFIWGYSLSYFKGCTIGAKRANSCVTAQNRASSSATGGYVFDQCLFTAAASATVDLKQLVFLGRPYSQYAKVIIKYSYLDSIIQPQGWKAWSTTDPRLNGATFAEFSNTGPGNWENNVAARTAFGNATLLPSDTYTLANVMASTSWIDMTYWNSIATPQPSTIIPAPVNTGNSTNPLPGACLVSKTPIAGQTTFSTIAQCISNLTSTSSLATIFIYPGTYQEQLTFNRSGPTVFRGYTDAPDSYSSNQVIITNAVVVNTQSAQSNSDSATLYSRGKNLKIYNINLVNTFGTASDYASLGFAIGNNGNASFYGCQIVGNQDTFDVNAGASVFAYNSYIEGSVDFIWGSGSTYFLASTISPNTNSVAITADKRATNTSVGGIVFDQCTVTPSAAGASVPGMAGSVFLGRPWNSNARVAYIQTFLDTCVNAAGWEVWSTSSPNTDGAYFGEYQNTGPGSVSTSRASFSHQMTTSEATEFQLANFFPSIAWIDLTALKISPFSAVYTPQTITVTSTILPTGSVPTVTITSTVVSLFKTSLPLSATTTTEIKNVTITVSAVQSDALQSTTLTGTTTSLSIVTPAVKLTTSTLTEGVPQTVTILGPTSTTIELSTSKITGTSVVTPLPVTNTHTVLVSDFQTQTVTPKIVSLVITSLSTQTSLSTSTPKGKTTTLKSTSTIVLQFTAATPQVTVVQTSTSLTTNVKTSTPKGVTHTTIFSTTLPAGQPVTVAAKNPVTSFVSVISMVLKTSKTTTTLSCTSAAVKIRRMVGSGDILGRPIAIRATSSSLYSTPTVTTFLTIPQSTSTFVVLVSTASTSTYQKTSSEKDKATSYFTKTLLLPATQTYISTFYATKVISKSTTLPVPTSTVTVDFIPPVVTVSSPGYTETQISIIFSTVKTKTSTTPGLTIQALISSTVLEITTTTLPVQTVQNTITSTEVVKLTTVLPTPTVTISQLATVTLSTTSTPLGMTATVNKLVLVTTSITTTLPVPTVLINSTTTSKIPAATVTVTGLVVKTTTVKSTSVVWSTVTKTNKGLPTCA